MGTLNFIIISVACLFTLSWLYGIRHKMQMANRASQSTINSTFLYIISIIIVLTFSFSPLNLLWMFPLAIVLGLFSFTFPFSLLSILSRPLEKFVYIGLDWNEIKTLQDDVQEVVRLMKMEKMTKEAAMVIIKDKRSEQKSNS